MNWINFRNYFFDWRKTAFVLFVGLIMIFPYIFLGEDVHIPVGDNMDSNIAWYKMLSDQGKIWSGPETLVQGMVKEIPRFSLPSGLNLELVFYGFMDPLNAYLVNKILIFFIGILSMYGFLNFWKGKWSSTVMILFALIWASLPFYPHRGISIAGLPLIALGMGYLWEGRRICLAFALIFLYSAYSMMVLAGIFAWSVAFMMFIMFCIYFKKWPKWVFGGFLFWLFLYLIQEYQLIYSYFIQNNFISHRSEMIYPGHEFSLVNVVKEITKGGYLGVYYWWGYLPLVFLGVFLGKIRNGVKKEIGVMLLIALILSFLSNVLNIPELVNFPGKLWPKLQSFSLIRFAHLIPFFVFTALALVMLEGTIPFKKILMVGLIALNIFPYHYEWRNMVNEQVPFLGYRAASFKEFYARDQYNKLKSIIPEAYQGYFGHINIHPAISAYNGLPCIDGYLQNYSLKHKNQIIKVLEDEIANNDFLNYHLKDWGNKCYLQNQKYPDEFDAFKWRDYTKIEDLAYDFDHLKNQLNVHYLISSIPISMDGLELVRKIDDHSSAWNLHLYRIQ
ncbi:DUF6044 family protein [Echinicola jeungdonensis]|uniref:DUF6044 family protein n=1 Tax=Echinicola jeungdonensis TaxID=709343 RepID=A0ABV5J811_9BACT|nr:DUF6044 family protein [Echinicola jeungdonensis]MDN3669966.1 DUF6044 family protein [Echinicola jeungdonensis]